jgi:hypothetical protein
LFFGIVLIQYFFFLLFALSSTEEKKIQFRNFFSLQTHFAPRRRKEKRTMSLKRNPLSDVNSLPDVTSLPDEVDLILPDRDDKEEEEQESEQEQEQEHEDADVAATGPEAPGSPATTTTTVLPSLDDLCDFGGAKDKINENKELMTPVTVTAEPDGAIPPFPGAVRLPLHIQTNEQAIAYMANHPPVPASTSAAPNSATTTSDANFGSSGIDLSKFADVIQRHSDTWNKVFSTEFTEAERRYLVEMKKIMFAAYVALLTFAGAAYSLTSTVETYVQYQIVIILVAFFSAYVWSPGSYYDFLRFLVQIWTRESVGGISLGLFMCVFYVIIQVLTTILLCFINFQFGNSAATIAAAANATAAAIGLNESSFVNTTGDLFSG